MTGRNSTEINRWIQEAINLYEKGETTKPQEPESLSNELLVKKARDAWLNESFHQIDELGELITKDSPDEAKEYYAYLLHEHGSCLLEEKKFEKAIEVYSDVLKIKPDSCETWNALGCAYRLTGLFEKGISCFKKALEIKPDYSQALYNLGKVCYDKSSYHEAIDYFKQALKLKPNDPEVLHELGNSFYKIGQKKLAINYFLKALKLMNYNIDDWIVNVGNIYGELDCIDEAIKYYEKAIGKNPENYKAFYNWGTVLSLLAMKKERDKAKELFKTAIYKFKKAIQIHPDHHEAYLNWGNVLSSLAAYYNDLESIRLYDLSINKYKEAISIKPDKAEAFFNWGLSLILRVKKKEGLDLEEVYWLAVDKFKKATELEPLYSHAFTYWGSTLYSLANMKNAKEAEELYNLAYEKFHKAIEIAPNDNKAYYIWGSSLVDLAATKSGKEAEELYRQAIKKYQKAIEIKPDYHEAYISLGWRHFCMGDLKLAEKYLMNSWDINDKDESTAMNIGHVYLVKGNTERALEMYKRSYELFRKKDNFRKNYDEDFEYVSKYGINKEEYNKMSHQIEQKVDKTKDKKEDK